ncbi:MAG: pseudouridine synthase [Proteobacteria bacterium SG_bin9]|nr:MAG: pseudouridine synthase [Proteobacteria bacterium SG_bin9]
MPRDNDKDNGRPRGPRSGPPRGGKGGFGGGGKGRSEGRSGSGRSRDDRPARSSAPRGDRKFGDKPFGEKRPYKPREDRGDRPFKPREDRGERSFKPREDRGDRPFKPRDRDDRAPRREYGDRPARSSAPRGDRKFGDKPFGDKRPYKPREDRGDRSFKPREDRGDRPFKPRDRDDRAPRREYGDRPARSSAPRGDRKFGDKPFGEKRPYKPREDRGDRPFKPREDRGDRPFKPRRDFAAGDDRSNEKPWERKDRDDRPRFSRDRDERPARSDRGPRKFDRPREDRDDRERPRFSRPREDRAPRGRSDWQEHPRNEGEERPRRENEDDSKIFTKRPAFGGRGAYRERPPEFDRRRSRDEAPPKKKTGERIAKLMARAGLASRRDAEEWVTQGRVTVNGRVINSPALDITENDKVLVDGKPLPERERTRLFLYHKPKGLMTTHDDPEGRPTVFDNLPEGLPRLISVGRLDYNTEGLLLLTNDGGLARTLELPDTGWLRRYRVRAHGEVTQAQLDELKNGVEVDGVKYGSIEAELERDQGSNVWITFAIREGKNREVRNVMAHLGLEVNRLIRISYGPFQLAEIAEGQVEEVKTRVLREQLGERIATRSGADFKIAEKSTDAEDDGAPRGKKPFKPKGKSGLVADRKGRKVLVTRSGSEESRRRNEDEAGFGPPKRPKRGYHGKRDLTPRDDLD